MRSTNNPFSNTPGMLLMLFSISLGFRIPSLNITSKIKLPWSVTTGPAFFVAILKVELPFISEITEIDDKIIRISQNWNTFKSKAGFVSDRDEPTNKFDNITISYKINDITDLNTFLHLGDNKKMLITNIKSDKDLFPDTPFSNILKLYKPLDEDIQELDNVYIVKEVLPQITETVDLYPYEQEEEQLNVLIPPDSPPKNSVIVNRPTPYSNYNTLITDDKRLQKDIEDKFVSGSDSVE